MSSTEPTVDSTPRAKPVRSLRAVPVVVLVVSGTALGLAGVDLVLPAMPDLPAHLGGSPGQAQLVLSAYVLGTAIGLWGCGAMSSVVRARWLLPGALGVLAVVSLLCSLAPDIGVLTGLRFLQGIASGAPAVLAPGLLRRLLDPDAAVRALGLLSSVEALVPAFAPLIGAGLIVGWGWQGPFIVMASLAVLGAAAGLLLRRSIPDAPANTATGSYRSLLRNPPYLRLAGSQALTLAGLLVFVFGAPTVIERDLHGSLGHFLALQVIGVAAFVIAANTSPIAARKWGATRLVVTGTALAAAGGIGLLAYAIAGGQDPGMLVPLLLPVNIGLGLRGPAGFMLALDAAGDDERGAAVIVLLGTLIAAIGNAVVAAFLDGGLVALAAVPAAVLTTALALLVLGPSLAGPRVRRSRR